MSTTFEGTITFFQVICGSCGMPFAFSEDYQSRRRADGKTFYCPSGHAISYRKSTEQCLREELQREKHSAEQARAESDRLRDSKNKLLGKISRIEKRVGNGVCPCCNRHFTNLERHMKTKHATRNPQPATRNTQ